MIKILIAVGFLLISLVSDELNKTEKDFFNEANITILDKSIEKEVKSFVDTLNLNEPYILKHRSEITMVLSKKSNEFRITINASSPYECLESFKGMINGYNGKVVYYLMTELDSKEVNKFFLIKEPIKCRSENTYNGIRLIINDKHIIEPLNMTWPNIQKEICYDSYSNEWFEM